MAYSWLSDAQLLARAAELREAAHNAPKNSPAYGHRANDWASVHDEVERRNAVWMRRARSNVALSATLTGPFIEEARKAAEGGSLLSGDVTTWCGEENCPGHVASENDPKVCGKCGVHIDSLRPDDDVG